MQLVTYRRGAAVSRADALIDDGGDIVAAASAARGWDQAPHARVLAMTEAGDAVLAQAHDPVRNPADGVPVAAADAVLHAPLQPPVQMRDCLLAKPARAYVYGYTILSDMSARDAQSAEMDGRPGPARGKDLDTSKPMGRCLVTADELADPCDLTIIGRINRGKRTRGKTGPMHWKFEDLIGHISPSETLYPGEFVGSGTVEGGRGIGHRRFLQPGDAVELQGIGVLRDRLVRPAQSFEGMPDGH